MNREREKYQAATQDKVDGLSAIPFISINDKVRYNLVSQTAHLVQYVGYGLDDRSIEFWFLAEGKIILCQYVQTSSEAHPHFLPIGCQGPSTQE